MRSLFLIAALMLCLATTHLHAQKDPPPIKITPAEKTPEEIAGKKLDVWIKELRHTDPSVRENAIRTLTYFGAPAREAVPEVVFVLSNDKDTSLRVNAALVLMAIELADRDITSVVQALSKRLQTDQQSIVRFHAAIALARFDEADGKEFIPSLIMGTKDPGSWEIRRAAVASLSKVGRDKEKGIDGPDPRATNAVIVAIGDPCAGVRIEAAMALGAMGIPTNVAVKQAAIKALQGHLNDRDKTVTIWSLVSLMVLENQPERYLEQLGKFLKAKEVPVRMQAARALGVMEAKAKPRIGDLIDAVNDKEAMVSGMACWAIGTIGAKVDPGERAVAALKYLTEDKMVHAEVKKLAQEAIDKIKGKTSASDTPR